MVLLVGSAQSQSNFKNYFCFGPSSVFDVASLGVIWGVGYCFGSCIQSPKEKLTAGVVGMLGLGGSVLLADFSTFFQTKIKFNKNNKTVSDLVITKNNMVRDIGGLLFVHGFTTGILNPKKTWNIDRVVQKGSEVVGFFGL